MKKKLTHRSERGQALILIVFAIIALIGMTALAVDGGNVYAERRRAQNAADAAALDAALALVRGGDLYAEGLASANANHYADGDSGPGFTNDAVNVEIYNEPSSGTYSDCDDPGFDCEEYIQVIITARVRTYFGRVLGIDEITNHVQAVARGVPPTVSPIAFGNAIVALSPNDCHAVSYQGNANTILTGGGIFVNSDCDGNGNQKAFFSQSTSSTLTTPCIAAVGGLSINDTTKIVYSPPNPDCPQTGASALTGLVYPDPTCTGDVEINGNTMSPGNWPPAGHHGSTKFPPSGVENLESGIYCLTEGNFDVNGGDTLVGNNVVIVVETGNVSINGGGNVTLTGPTEGPYVGLTIFVPENNDGTVTINGDGTVNITGTILAPACDVTLNGSGSTFTIHSQVIGWNVDLSGTATTNIQYDDNNNYDAPIPPQIELIQ